ncbi:RNAPII degradation factor [Coemansia sp. RSA 988]|nr:RNAPII degradation factor [Coemansia sp. RSA 988]
MSTAHSNTQQASFSNTRGSKASRSAKSTSLEEASELKALHSKYSGSVKALKELFPGWTEDDLLSAFKDAEGDLEGTINNIAEGHATQWGEVKSRKEKRQAVKQPKPKIHHDETRPLEKGSHVPRPASFRAGVRGGAARGGRGNPHAAGNRGRAAPAAKTPLSVPAPAFNAGSSAGWDMNPASGSAAADGWATEEPQQPDQVTNATTTAAPSNTVVNGTAPAATPAVMSWASIAKRGVKQEPAEPSKKAELSEDAAGWDFGTEDIQPEETEVAVAEVLASESAEHVDNDEAVVETVVKETVADDGSTVKVEETTVTQVPREAADQQPSVVSVESTVKETIAEEPQAAISSPRKHTSSARRLKQDAPVVMPSGNSAVERIGVQFGSLSIGGVELGSLKSVGASATAEKLANEPVAPQSEVKEPVQPVAAPSVAPKVEAAAPAPAPAQPAPTQPAAADTAAPQGPLTTYLQQQQQQHASTQAQPHPNASAIGQMPLPNDYGAAALYGADVQRNMMGFYDNYGYGQFVANKEAAGAGTSATDSQTPAAGGSQTAGANGSSNISQAGPFPQQVPQPFGMNHGMPYYNPYYYSMMQPGGQYHNPAFGNNPALAAAYSQPFMKQSMYPMYLGGTPQGPQSATSQQPQQPSQQAAQQPHAGVPSQHQQHQGMPQPQHQQPQQQPQQVNAQQAGVNGAGVPANAAYNSINAQKPANPYGHYSGNIGSGFAMYDQDSTVLSNSPQQFGLGGIPGILSASKSGSKDASAKSIHPAGTAPVIGGTTYYSAPQQHQQQVGSYPSQASNAHPQGYSHHQQAYYNPYAPSYQSPAQHVFQQQPQQQQQQQQHPTAQPGHQQQSKQYWEKQ